MADLWENDYFDGRFCHNGDPEAIPGLLHRRLVRPGDGLDQEGQEATDEAVLPLPADQRRPRPALGARQVQGALPGAAARPPSSA